MSTSDQQAPPRHLAMPELLIGIGLLACAAAVAWQTLAIPVSPLYSKVGPTVFPYLTMTGMLVLSLLLIVAALRGGWQPEEEKETPTDWKAMGFVAAGLVALTCGSLVENGGDPAIAGPALLDRLSEGV